MRGGGRRRRKKNLLLTEFFGLESSVGQIGNSIRALDQNFDHLTLFKDFHKDSIIYLDTMLPQVTGRANGKNKRLKVIFISIICPDLRYKEPYM